MGRNKQYTDAVLEEYYNKIVTELKNDGGAIYRDDMAARVCLTPGQISKALQYARRRFEEGKTKITEYVMASPDGYFLPTMGREIVAYVAQIFMDTRSRVKTIMPIYEYAKRHWGNELLEEIDARLKEDDVLEDEMIPWAVFDTILNQKKEEDKNANNRLD